MKTKKLKDLKKRRIEYHKRKVSMRTITRKSRAGIKYTKYEQVIPQAPNGDNHAAKRKTDAQGRTMPERMRQYKITAQNRKEKEDRMKSEMKKVERAEQRKKVRAIIKQ